LLLLPASTVSGTISFIDAIFTATSAVCVTGLIVVDTGSYFTLFGQNIILALIQLGGLCCRPFLMAYHSSMNRSFHLWCTRIVTELFSYRLSNLIFL